MTKLQSSYFYLSTGVLFWQLLSFQVSVIITLHPDFRFCWRRLIELVGKISVLVGGALWWWVYETYNKRRHMVNYTCHLKPLWITGNCAMFWYSSTRCECISGLSVETFEMSRVTCSALESFERVQLALLANTFNLFAHYHELLLFLLSLIYIIGIIFDRFIRIQNDFILQRGCQQRFV